MYVSLLDGEDCRDTRSGSCCDLNSPPYFSTALPSATTTSIEVQICTNQETSDENVYIQQCNSTYNDNEQ